MLLRAISWRWIALFMVVAALPMLVVAVPGASDYPNHLARMHVLSRIGSGSSLDRFFAVDWRWIGNLGVDLPVVMLAPLLGIETATRLIGALIAPLTVAGILMLSRSAHGRITGGAMLALPFAFAQPFLFGFLNYCLSVALALIVAALWNARPRQTPLTLVGFGIGALVIWTAHVMGWAILLLLVAGAELSSVRSARDLWARILRAAPLLAPVIPLLLWRGEGGSGGALFWQSPHVLASKAMNFVTVLKGLWLPFDLAMTAIIGLAAVFALLSAGARKLEPRLATGGILLLLAALALPTTVLGSWGADLRLTPVAVMIAVMSIGPATSPRRENLLLTIGASLFILRAAWVTAQWHRSDRVLTARLAILDAVPVGSRLGFLSVGTPTQWTLTPDRKLAAYAVVRRDAFTNTLFQIPGSDLMVFRVPGDRARWFDGSQDVVDLRALKTRITGMQSDGFNAIWVAGLAPAPPIPGYTAAYASGTDTLFLKAGPRAAPR